jgi:hypothetical protein
MIAKIGSSNRFFKSVFEFDALELSRVVNMSIPKNMLFGTCYLTSGSCAQMASDTTLWRHLQNLALPAASGVIAMDHIMVVAQACRMCLPVPPLM